jgi:integrase
MKLPKHVKGYTVGDRQYFYFRGTKVRLPGLPWSPEFMDVHARMMATLAAPGPVVIGASRTLTGTVNAGLVAYYTSTRFTHDLGEGTQGARRNLLERFRAEHGDKRLRKLEPRHVQAYISSLATPAAQRSMLQALKSYLDYCVEISMIAANPASDTKRDKLVNTGGILTWTEQHVAKFKATHPLGSRARLALALYLNLGVRKSDVVRVGRHHVVDNVLVDFLPVKTTRTGGRLINVPLMQETLDTIAATKITGKDTYLVTGQGKAFTAAGFGNKMREWCDEAGLPECSSHGLRKLCLVRLADIEGMDVLHLQAISGHKDLRELQIYIENANRKRKAKHAIEMLEAAQKANDQVSKSKARLDNSGKK